VAALLLFAAALLGPLPGQAALTGGGLIVAPRDGALDMAGPVRIVVKVPRGGRVVDARVDLRSIAKRLRPTGRHGRVAELDRKTLELGSHRLYVMVRDRRGRQQSASGRFWVGRRSPGLARVVLPRGTRSARPVRVAIRTRPRIEWLTVTLNGRRVERAFAIVPNGVREAVLSASHGLHHGRNVLRVVALAPNGRFTRVVRRFRVRRDGPLAGAGRDRRTRVGRAVRLDGRASRASHPRRRLTYRWALVRHPRGSAAKLLGARTRRPLLRTDRFGPYRVRLTVRERGRAHAAVSADAVRSDVTEISAAPLDPPLGVVMHTIDPGGAITIGDQTYPNPAVAPAVQRIHVLVLDPQTRATEPNGHAAYCNWGKADGACPGGGGTIDDLRTMIAGLKGNPLVIMTAIAIDDAHNAVEPSGQNSFNAIVQSLGGEPFTGQQMEDGPLSVIGVAGGQAGGAWQNAQLRLANPVRPSASEPGQAGDLAGYLAQACVPPAPKTTQGCVLGDYSFISPDYVPFHTSAETQPNNQATMALGGTTVAQGSLGQGVTGGFLVVTLNSGTLQRLNSTQFNTNHDAGAGGAAQDTDPQQQMANYLNGLSGDPTKLVMVQSIGTVKATTAEWGQIARAIEKLGGNRHVFNTANGSYALVGGTHMDPLEASSATAVGLSQLQGGQATGLLDRRRDSRYEPGLAEPLAQLDYSLLPLTYQDPVPWPCSTSGAQCTAAHEAAGAKLVAQINAAESVAGELGNTLAQFRASYQTSPVTWSNIHGDLIEPTTVSCPASGGTLAETSVTGSPTGGSFQLVIDGQAAVIQWNATAQQAQEAIQALPNIGSGEVTVTGGPLPDSTLEVLLAPDRNVQPGANNLMGGSPKPSISSSSYTESDCDELRLELLSEVNWVGDVQNLFGKPGTPTNGLLQAVFTAPGLASNMQTAADNIKKAVEPPDDAHISVDGLGLAEGIFDFVDAVGVELPGFGVLAAGLEIADAFHPPGDQTLERIDTTVENLDQTLANETSDTGIRINQIGRILVSDYGKLSVAGPKSAVTGSGGWWNPDNTPPAITNGMIATTRKLVSETLLPLIYQAWVLLPTSQNPNLAVTTTAEYQCWWATSGTRHGWHPFAAEPPTGQLLYTIDWAGNPGQVTPRNVIWALGKPDRDLWNDAPDLPHLPAKAITDALFQALQLGHTEAAAGMGLQQPSFLVDNFPRQTLGCNYYGGLKESQWMVFGTPQPPGTPVPDCTFTQPTFCSPICTANCPSASLRSSRPTTTATSGGRRAESRTRTPASIGSPSGGDP
jgi:hypothetical protein